VCTSLDEVQLGDLTCSDKEGLADSATSRYGVIDMLRVMPTAEDCPEQEVVSSRLVILSFTCTVHSAMYSCLGGLTLLQGNTRPVCAAAAGLWQCMSSKRIVLRSSTWAQEEGVADFKISEEGHMLPGGALTTFCIANSCVQYLQGATCRFCRRCTQYAANIMYFYSPIHPFICGIV